jgi:DNA-cytosine methyltransferase
VIDVEIFSCAGGMAEGFRRAGICFDLAVDLAKDHCDSYERNLGHRPVQMDVRDLLRLVRLGVAPRVRLLVADPPCTPWSRAGKRKGIKDERDMIRETADLIGILRPQAYLIGNVPGLEDASNLAIVQEVIGGLARFGYCVSDFAALDAANYGVPQHRVRPFWFGHLHGPCIRWPAPTHGAPEDAGDTLPGIHQLLPWTSCREALGHLTPKELGRTVFLRRRTARPRSGGGGHNPSFADRPAKTLVLNERHAPASLDAPAPTMLAKYRGNSAQMLRMDDPQGSIQADRPSRTITTQAQHTAVLRSALPQSQRVVDANGPSDTIQAREDRLGYGMTMSWPEAPAPSTARKRRKAPARDRAVLLSERAAAILQGFPESWVFSGKTKRSRWSQIGQAMPPPLSFVVAGAIVQQIAATVGDAPAERFVAWTPPAPRAAEAAPREQLELGPIARAS